MVVDNFTNFKNKLGQKLNEEIKKSSAKKQKYINDNIKQDNNEEKKNIGKEEKIPNIKKKKLTVKNESLIRLIHQYNTNKDKDKEIKP